MEHDELFADFDQEKTFEWTEKRALDENTKNFVIEFGKDEAQIAFDLGSPELKTILSAPAQRERPIRWINIWGPNRQKEEVTLIGKHYGFTDRLLAIIRTDPEPETQSRAEKLGLRQRMFHKDDVELGAVSLDIPRHSRSTPHGSPHYDASHYTIVKQMINYHAIDYGDRYICIAANWLHEQKSELPMKSDKEKNIAEEGKQRRLYSWLVLCDDNTVISLHEDIGQNNTPADIESIRSNPLSVLKQLSMLQYDKTDPISRQTVRQALGSDPDLAGLEGASNLFYYLFDDWRAVYATVAVFQHRLKNLQKEIFASTSRRSNTVPNVEIIPRLHILGSRIRQMQHVYEGYKNLIQRILLPVDSTHTNGQAASRSPSFGPGPVPIQNKGVQLARNARARFERLSDRLELLILSQTNELSAEKDALISTYFNINTQKDTESTARLSRAATLLAKLSVLFLPVSLMTSYFSVQIQDLQGVYTSKQYWYAFAVIMSISFLFLFFFSKFLMWVTETLDAWMKQFSHAVGRFCRDKFGRRET